MSDIIHPKEFEDYKYILEVGAKKYGANNWLKHDGKNSSFKAMHNSLFHHVAESYAAGPFAFGQPERQDVDSKLDPLLHAMCRCVMVYTRLKQGVHHPDDYKDFGHFIK